MQSPVDLIRLWMHETQRVYGDKLTDEKDIESFLKLQLDILKKNIEEMDEGAVLERPNIYCHFAGSYFNFNLVSIKKLIIWKFIGKIRTYLKN